MASVKRWIFVGGTATSIAAMLQKLDVYDASRVQGFVLEPEEVSDLLKQLFSMSYEERCHISARPNVPILLLVALGSHSGCTAGIFCYP